MGKEMKMDRTNILRLLLGATLAAFVAATAYGDAQKVPPDAASGGGIAASDNVDWTGSHSFLDGTYFSLKDDVDPTKILRFQLSGITAGQTRTITVPDANLTLPTAFIGGSLGATDNAILRADGTGGATAQASDVTLSDAEALYGLTQLDIIGGTPATQFLRLRTNSGVGTFETYTSFLFAFTGGGGSALGLQDIGSGIAAVSLPSGGRLGFSSSSTIGSPDTYLSRSAAGVMTFSGSGGALGYALAGVAIEANTGTKNVTVAESGECYTNTGDADGSTINLPNDPTIGAQVCVLLTVSQSVTVAPAAGETISDNGTAYSTSCVADALGESITLVAATGGSGATWVPRSKVGTWTCS